METLTILIQVLIQVVVFLVFLGIILIIKKYLPAYFSEKGKNLATKEDIEEITEKVKTVESSISILTGNIVDYNALKRSYIIDYYVAFNNWLRTISNAKIDYSEDYEQMNKKMLNAIEEAKHLYNLKEGEIELFINDHKFYHLRAPLSTKTLEYQHDLERFTDYLNKMYKTKPENYEIEIYSKRNKLGEDRVQYTKDINALKNKLVQYLEQELKFMMKKENKL